MKKSEICAYAGELYKNKSAFKDHFEVAKKEIMRLVKELDATELRELTKIEEPQTFKVGEKRICPLKWLRNLVYKKPASLSLSATPMSPLK